MYRKKEEVRGKRLPAFTASQQIIEANAILFKKLVDLEKSSIFAEDIKQKDIIDYKLLKLE